ncbi:hypothetical protein [Pseudacidovorax intermedius]|uniref:hypothetical protein n=1 Tax=Pseudacidovorax intermedius TaxID=433924 RepID=UPI0005C28DDA|nr:hypothetical protein [Pseudacidovorax intermedius]
MPMSHADPADGRTAVAPARSMVARACASDAPGPDVDRGGSPHDGMDAFRTRTRRRRWLDAVLDLLECAEARVTANFRVPPGGG